MTENGNGLRVPRWAIYAVVLLGSLAIAAFQAGQRVGEDRAASDRKLMAVDSTLSRLVRRVCRLEGTVTVLAQTISRVNNIPLPEVTPPDLDCK